VAGSGDFSSDGKQIAYVQRSDAGELEVVVEQVDGSGSEVVATGELPWTVAFVPGQNQLVLVRQDSLSLLSLKDGQEKGLLAYSGTPYGRLWFSPGGQKLLFGYQQDSTRYWHLVDLKSGAEQRLDDLEGYYPIYLNAEHRWMFFSDYQGAKQGMHFASLDLESGETHPIRGLDEEALYSASGLFSPRDGVGVILGLDKPVTWFVQAGEGQAHALAEGWVNRYAVSPDGRWAVASKRDAANRTYTLTIIQLEGEQTHPLGEGVWPVWVRP
jgi:hypothetical protein